MIKLINKVNYSLEMKSISSYEKERKTFIIAEIGQAHDGSLGILHSLIESIADTGVNAIKFQVHIAKSESSIKEPFRKKFSYVDSSRIEYWKRMELKLEEWKGIKIKCDKLGVEFLATPFSNLAVDLLEELEVKRYKIGSGDINNYLLLDKVARTKKEIIISSGLGSINEVDETIDFLKQKKTNIALLKCTSKYPTPPEEIELNMINELKSRYKIPIGLSDHSGQIYTGIGAVCSGACVVESHVTFDKRMFGPDSKASLTIEQLTNMVKGVRFMEKACKPISEDTSKVCNKRMQNIFGRSLSINKSMKAGQTIQFDDLEAKKPAKEGIDPRSYNSIIGKTLINDKSAWDFLNHKDINQ